MEKMKSIYGYTYKTKVIEILDFELISLSDLDENVDILCNHFEVNEDNVDQVLHEDHCPYFGVLWEAGVGLSQYLEKKNYKGLRVLEIGSGLALPSFVLSRKGNDVLATDFHQDVKNFIDVNQNRNNIFFDYSLMNWRDEIERTKYNFGLFDLVIGSDILYESQHSDQVAKALVNLLKPEGTIILSDPGRAYMQQFINAMNDLGKKENKFIEKVSGEFSQNKKEREVFIFEYN